MQSGDEEERGTYGDVRYQYNEKHDVLYTFRGSIKNKTGTVTCDIYKAGIQVTYVYDSSSKEFKCPDENYVSQYGLKKSIDFGSIKQWDKENPEEERVGFTLQEMIGKGDDFLLEGDKKISNRTMNSISNNIYNILFTIGIVLAFIVGGILAIKFITSGLEGKAEVKQLMIPYIVGLVVIFGAFTIWKIVLTILQ